MSNTFDDFALLPIEVQREALREGEVLLNAQLAVATAADQRALTWAGFLIASATASLGGGIALLTKAPSDAFLALLAIIFSGSLLTASWWAVSTVAPKLFCLPGVRPGLWLPDEETLQGTNVKREQRERNDRARDMNSHILENMKSASQRANKMHTSFKLVFRTVTAASIILGGVLVQRYVTIREPTSEIIIGPTEPEGMAICAVDPASQKLRCKRYSAAASE